MGPHEHLVSLCRNQGWDRPGTWYPTHLWGTYWSKALATTLSGTSIAMETLRLAPVFPHCSGQWPSNPMSMRGSK
jgi:hypothetical protein